MGLYHRRISGGESKALVGVVLDLGPSVFLGLFRFLVAGRPPKSEWHNPGSSIDEADTSAVLTWFSERRGRVVSQGTA